MTDAEQDNRLWCEECGTYEGETDLYPCDKCEDLFCLDCESLHVGHHSRKEHGLDD